MKTPTRHGYQIIAKDNNSPITHCQLTHFLLPALITFFIFKIKYDTVHLSTFTYHHTKVRRTE